MENIKLIISTKILDFVECFPKFRKGTIATLQTIREYQREWSEKDYSERKAPKDSRIDLNQITLILTFEHEDYHLVIKGLKRYFPKNKEIEKFVESLRGSLDSLHACSWNNLGYIAREKGVYRPLVEIDESLPENIKSVSLSFHRIIPSISCIIFEFRLEEEASKALSRVQNLVYLGPIEFKRLWPLNKLHSGYSIGNGYDCSTKAINKEKDHIRKNLELWIKNSFSWKPKVMKQVSYVDVYRLVGNPDEIEQRRNWMSKNRGWLNDYGIFANGLDSLEGEDFLISKYRHNDGEYFVSNVITKFDTKSGSEFGDFLEFKVRAVAVSATIFSVLNKYRNKVEKLRGHGFKNLYKRRKLSRRNQYNIQEIKRTISFLSRLEQELKQSQYWINHSISEVGKLIRVAKEKPVDLGKETISNAAYQLQQVKQAAEIIDSGLTNYLSVQSIYVMYKLQKRMFILTIVVTVATIIGVLSGWHDLKALLDSWLNA